MRLREVLPQVRHVVADFAADGARRQALVQLEVRQERAMRAVTATADAAVERESVACKQQKRSAQRGSSGDCRDLGPGRQLAAPVSPRGHDTETKERCTGLRGWFSWCCEFTSEEYEYWNVE